MTLPRAALAAGLVLLALATGALAMPPKGSVFEVDGVEYMYITGVNHTSTAVLGPAADGSGALPIATCAFIQVHPGSPFGVMRVHGLQEHSIDIDLRVDQLRLPNGTRGYAFDTLVEEDGHQAMADLAFAGNGSMRVRSERYVDPVASTGIPELDDLVPDLVGTVGVLAQGTRDDGTGAIADALQDDGELHLHLRSSPDANPARIAHSFDSGILIPSTQAYGDTDVFQNLKFGGQARWDIAATSHGQPGSTELTFVAIAPNGTEVANVTVAPSLLQDDGATVEFPLAAFGPYTVRVSGSATLASYESTITLSPPESFDLHLWWENVTYGYQAYQDYRACTDVLGTPNSIIGVDRIIGRPQPPQYNVVYAILGVTGGVGLATVAIKLAADQVSMSVFRKNK